MPDRDGEIDENRGPLLFREVGVGRCRYQVKLHSGHSRAVVKDAAVADDDDPGLAETSSRARSLAVNSGLMPAGSPSQALQSVSSESPGRFCGQFVWRDINGVDGDRGIILPIVRQITGINSSAAPSKISVVTSGFAKNIPSEPSTSAWIGEMHLPPCRQSRSRAPAAPGDSEVS